MSGYDQFFKEAGKASGLITGKPVKGAGKARPQSKPSAKPKFKLQGTEAKPEATSKSRDRIRIGTPEEQLRKEIARRTKEKKSASMKKRQAFPVFPAIVAVIALASSAVGYFQPELMDQALARVSSISGIEISMFGSANAAADLDHGKAGAKKSAKPDAKKAANTAEPAKSETGAHGDSAGVAAAVAGATDVSNVAAAGEAPKPSDIRNWSDEELSFFNKLNDRKKELDLREAELAKLEEELGKQKTDLDEKLKQLEAMRAEISKTLKTRVAVDQEKVDKLVQTYSTMKAQNAAKIIETLNEDLAVEVMDKMKKKNAAEIMNMMDAKKARRLSELLTGYQRSPANAADESGAAEQPETTQN